MSFIIHDLKPVVIRGPFAGLILSENSSKCSSTQAKIYGCYEKELEDIVERSINKKYEIVLNVGCAEGFYSIGFAKRMPKCFVYSFDIDPAHKQVFYETAALNNVTSRVQYLDAFTADFISKNCPTNSKLFFCDCEGEEINIISDEFLSQNQNMDFIVETHDFIGKPICAVLEQRFYRHGYKVHKLKSIEDNERAIMFHIPELMNFDFETKKDVIKEYRPCPMTWLYCTK